MLLRIIFLSHISTYLYVLRTSVRKKSHLTNSKLTDEIEKNPNIYDKLYRNKICYLDRSKV